MLVNFWLWSLNIHLCNNTYRHTAWLTKCTHHNVCVCMKVRAREWESGCNLLFLSHHDGVRGSSILFGTFRVTVLCRALTQHALPFRVSALSLSAESPLIMVPIDRSSFFRCQVQKKNNFNARSVWILVVTEQEMGGEYFFSSVRRVLAFAIQSLKFFLLLMKQRRPPHITFLASLPLLSGPRPLSPDPCLLPAGQLLGLLPPTLLVGNGFYLFV